MSNQIPNESPYRKWFYQSRIHELNGRFQAALDCANNIKTVEPISTETRSLYAIAVGYAYWRLIRFDEGFSVLHETLDNLDDSTDPALSASLYNVLGLLYWKTGKNEEALENFQLAKELRNKMKLLPELSYALNNLGNTYLNMDDMKKAFGYYSQAFELRTELQIKPGIAASHNSFARYYEKYGDMEKALEHHTISLEIWKQVNNIQFIAKSQRFLGSYYHKTQQNELSQYHFTLALDLFKSIPNPIDIDITINMMSKITT